MPETQKIKSPVNVYIWIALIFVLGDIMFLFFTKNQNRTLELLTNEVKILKAEEALSGSANEIYIQYQNEVDIISQVFPSEEELPTFVQTLEKILGELTNEYTFKFNAITPIKEQDKLFLPMTLTLRIDLQKLTQLLEKLERLPYLTHVTGIIAKTPDGFTNNGEIIIGVKLYVKNPFTNS